MRTSAWLLGLVAVVGITSGAPGPAGAEPSLEPSLEPYPLDGVPRVISPRGPVRCPTVDLVTYRGDVIRYHKPVRVYPALAPRLVGLELIVSEVAIEVYGRAPRKLRHVGTYNCRRIAAYPELLSEHGLGNGIDVEGFDFGPATVPLPPGLPRALRGAFDVRLGRDWRRERGVGAIHARFLRTLAQRLIARDDLFRVLLGPAWPGHAGHFHFDMAPFRLVAIFDDDPDAPPPR